jgi:hypothetical protein
MRAAENSGSFLLLSVEPLRQNGTDSIDDNQKRPLSGAPPILRTLGKLNPSSGPACKRPRRVALNPSLEPLEKKLVLSTFTPIPLGSAANGSYAAIDPAFPTGNVTLGGVPFVIPAKGNNVVWNNYPAGPKTGIIVKDFPVRVAGVTQVHTLINTAYGQAGPNSYLSLEFIGSGGADFKVPLIGNVNIRDFNDWVWTNYINNTSTVNVFNNPSHTHRIDMQNITLPAAFANQTLTDIKMIDAGAYLFQRAILYGITVDTRPTTAELYTQSVLAYELSEGTYSVPAGWTELLPSPAAQVSDGFEAVAVRDPGGNVIIVNEGTVPGKTVYDINGVKADASILLDQTPTALVDAAEFAQVVQSRYAGPIYVAGHSLGGIEAQMEAKALGANCGGGATFGASGLPGNTSSGPSTLVNYVDYGDPVGNGSTDPGSPLASLFAPGNMRHFGAVMMLGSPSDASVLLNNAPAVSSLLASTDAWSVLKTFAGEVGDGSMITAYREVPSAFAYHGVVNYGADLALWTPNVTVRPALDIYLMMIGIPLGKASYTKVMNGVVQPDGSFVSPAITISSDATTGQVVIRQTADLNGQVGTVLAGGVTTLLTNLSTGFPVSLTYVSPDKSVYSATLDAASRAFKTLQVNESNGESYQISYEVTNSQPWKLTATFYQGLNDQGPVYQIVDNWDAGGSQVQTFNNLPPGYSKRLSNYSGPNGTGTLLSTVYIK